MTSQTIRNLNYLILIGLVLALLLSACAAKNGSPSNTSPATVSLPNMDQPITLSVVGYWDPATFDKQFNNFVQQKYPKVTLNYTQVSGAKDTKLQQMVAAGTPPDLLMANNIVNVTGWESLGMTYDVTSLIKSFSYDTNRIDPAQIAGIRAVAPHGELYAMPFYSFHNVLFYNKSIYDKFGISYPKDGITWPQAYELAKNLTRNVDGVQYRGLDPDYYVRLTSEYSLRFVDPKTDKAVVAADPKWATVMDYLKNVYQIPGNLPDPSLIGSGNRSFTQDRTLAMWINGTGQTQNMQALLSAAGEDWDMVSLPTWPDAPNVGEAPSCALISINPSSQYKEQAFQIITYMLSDEVQTSLNEIGLATVLTNPDIKKTFGANLPYLKGKDTQAAFFDKPAPVQQVSSYDLQTTATEPMKNALLDMISGKLDVNSALQQAGDQINQNIVKAKQQQ